MGITRKENNINILTSLSPRFVGAWNDIVNHNFTEFVSAVEFEKLPPEQQLCCLHLASLASRLEKIPPLKGVDVSEDMSELDEYQCFMLDLMQKKDYKQAMTFIKDNFSDKTTEKQLFLPKEFSKDEKISLLFLASLSGWSVEPHQIYRLYEKKDVMGNMPFNFTKHNQLHAGQVIETSTLSVVNGQTIPWNMKGEFKKFTKSFKKIPYGMITRKPTSDIKDWHFKLLRKDGAIIDVDKEKFLNRHKKDTAHTV